MCKFIQILFLLATASTFSATHVAAGEVEVLHFWTSPGEAKSIDEIKRLIAVRGHTWKDFVVTGGGGGNAMTALKQRVLSGSPPASASIKGPAIQEWASLNTFTSLDAMAQFDHWDGIIPKVIQDQLKYKGRYVAVPVNIHRVNWLWSNSDILKKAGVKEVPATYEAFILAAQKVQAAGYIPIAHGGQSWQDFTLFESVLLGVTELDFYKRAFIRFDSTAFSSNDMRKALEAFRRIKPFTDDKSKGRDWNAATEMVIKGRAAFQIMGDWAKGEFLVAGQRPGIEFTCTPAPGTVNAFAYVVDAFAMFQLKGWEAQKAQGYLAYVLLGKEFQESFNLRKGSIPVRNDVSLEKFDECGKTAGRDFNRLLKSEGAVPSAAVNMTLSTALKADLEAIISEYWNNEALSTTDAMEKMAVAVTRQLASPTASSIAKAASNPKIKDKK